MRYRPLLLALAALSPAAAFQTSHLPATRLRTTRLFDEPIVAEPSHGEPQRLILPARSPKLGLLSRLTTAQLSALTTLKKDERRAFNKRRLLRMGVTTMSALLLSRSNSAIAATPLVVAHGAVSPLIFAPGMGAVAMPRQAHQVAGGMPNQGAVGFAIALFLSTTLLRAAGGGHGKLSHFLLKHLGPMEREKDDIELGLPSETSWDAYAHTRVDPLKKKQEAGGAGTYAFNKFTMLFEKAKSRFEENHGAEEARLEKAEKHFREQQFKQHHHPVHVARSQFEQASYLDSLPINEEGHHDMPRGYLDTLSGATSTWDAYKQKLEGAKPATEVDGLKQEVSTLHNMMQIEQSMYQASNRALQLAMEAQGEELQHSSTSDALKDFDATLSTHEELKEFDRKARAYEETVVEDEKRMSKKEKKETSTPEKWLW